MNATYAKHNGKTMTKNIPVKPVQGSLWERKRDRTLVRVDNVRKSTVTYTTVYMLIVWDTQLDKWHKNFRPHVPTAQEAEDASQVPDIKEEV